MHISHLNFPHINITHTHSDLSNLGTTAGDRHSLRVVAASAFSFGGGGAERGNHAAAPLARLIKPAHLCLIPHLEQVAASPAEPLPPAHTPPPPPLPRCRADKQRRPPGRVLTRAFWLLWLFDRLKFRARELLKVESQIKSLIVGDGGDWGGGVRY